MTDEEARAVELMFPPSVWGRVVMEAVNDPGSPYTHAFYFKDVPVEACLEPEEKEQ